MSTPNRLSSADALKALSQQRVLPAFPQVITRLDEALAASSISLEKIVAILSTDLTTAGRIVKAASGFRYGPQPPKDLAEAVMRIGFQETRAIAFAVAYTNSFVKPKNFSMTAFWSHAFVSGLAAKEIVAWFYRHKQIRICDAPTAFLLGISHEIGCLLLDRLNEDGFLDVVQALKSTTESQSEVEQRMLGTTHAVLGAALLKYWGFSEQMVMAVAAHHFPGRLPPALQPIADTVLLSENLTTYIGFANGVDHTTPDMIHGITNERMQKLGMTETDFLRMSERIKDAMAEEDWLELATSMG